MMRGEGGSGTPPYDSSNEEEWGHIEWCSV